MANETMGAGGGWVFLAPDAVPERWAERAIPVMLVPLTPDESGQMLNSQPVEVDKLTPDSDLVRLVARGLSAEVIARRLGIASRSVYRRLARLRDAFGVGSTASRSVYRRLARLRDAFGVGSTAELAAELAKRGFGTDPVGNDQGGEHP